MNNDLISREDLLKAMEEERQFLLARGATGAEHILVHHCLPLIDNAPTVVGKLSDKQIEEIADLLEIQWGYEGIREDVSRILRGEDHD